MSVYPFSLDNDTTIFRVDDNITEIAGENFNQVRDAIFKIEEELGIKPSGIRGNLKNFLSTSFNDDGYIKASVLNMVGLATLPIVNSHVGVNAGISESKLDLDYTTSSLHLLIQNQASSIGSLQSIANQTTIDLNSHIDGGPSSNLRHVASHIDLNAVPVDSRDLSYIWNGLRNVDGYKTADTVAEALYEINEELVSHQTTETIAHPATAITVDTSQFKEISNEATNVQLALEDLDNFEENRLGTHRVSMHSNGVSNVVKSQAIKSFNSRTELFSIDGYGLTVVYPRNVTTTVASYPTGIEPLDDVIVGDNIIKFNTPTNSTEIYNLDSEFSKVKSGDLIRVYYGDGYNLETIHIIESINFVPGTTWNVRIADNNILDQIVPTTARIDTSLIDNETSGILAAGTANVSIFNGIGSVTVADPKSASTLGIGFDPNQLDENHYNLYLQIYPTGNPFEKAITLAPIDVTGDRGASKGTYTLESVIQATNNAFRAPGFNYRFVAYQHNGNFGIALTDSINGCAFSAYYTNSLGNIYTRSVIDGYYDALGLGPNGSNSAGKIFQTSFVDSIDATTSCKIFYPRKERKYIAGGIAKDLLKTSLDDGYFIASITNRTQSAGNAEITYTVHERRLDNIGLMPGKTITVQPTISYTSSTYNDRDYGRFMIKDVSFIDTCPSCEIQTVITVVNGIHGTGNPTDATSLSGDVRIYFSNDSVGFNFNHVSDGAQNLTDYHRLHNIFVDENGRTFSHERARMPIQTNPGQLLSSNWHIYDVSPKLKGYKSSSNYQNRNIRFYISGYNVTSGEIDGYIGQPGPGATVINKGVTVRGRKNTPIRFYTQSNIDYIELYYNETNTIPTNIEIGRYIDIDIYQSLDNDRQFASIASVEVSDTTLGYFKDKRQFGTISEIEFSNSAKDYITSGNRELNSNGVISGLELVSYNESTSLYEFNGGFALVNGKVIAVNESFIKIPSVEFNPSPMKQEIAICVNEDGKLETLWLTDIKTHTFYSDPDTTNTLKYINSCTFNELVSDRKDLCIISIYNTLSVIDARKFVSDQNNNNCFVWGRKGTFRTLESVLLWANKIGDTFEKDFSNKIIIRGEVTINNSILFSNYLGYKNILSLEGDGATVIINSNTGLFIQNKISIKNINFIYNPTTVPASNPFVTNVNLSGPEAAILLYGYNNSTVSDIEISGCTFKNTGTSLYRHPFILCLFDNNYAYNIKIENNKFYDNGAKTNAAIVFSEVNITDIQQSRLDNVFVNKNWCNGTQGIFVTSQRINQSASTSGIFVSNFNITNNTCGKIGFLTSGEEFIPQALTTLIEWNNDINPFIYGFSGPTSSSLNIEGNTCDWIYTCQTDGYGHNGLSSGTRHPICNVGQVNINNNKLTACRIYCGATTINSGLLCHIKINKNNIIYSSIENINPNNTSIITELTGITISSLQVLGMYGSSDIMQNKISENILSEKYYRSINIYGLTSNVSSNNISGWIFSAISSTPREGFILNNHFNRNDFTVDRYIFAAGDVLIDGNRLDSHLVNNSDLNSWNHTILTAINLGKSPIVGRNINHEQELVINLNNYNARFNNSASLWTGSANYLIFDSCNISASFNNSDLGFVVTHSSQPKNFYIFYNLNDFIKYKSYVTNYALEVDTVSSDGATFAYSTRVVDSNFNVYGLVTRSAEVINSPIHEYIDQDINCRSDNSSVQLGFQWDNGTGFSTTRFMNLTIRYRY
jgi:hypothetical protein